MIPIHDNNPTRRRSWITVLLILACCAVYFGVQPVGRSLFGHVGAAGQSVSCAELKFDIAHAAVPYEVTHLHVSSGASRQAELSSLGCTVTAQPRKNLLVSLLVTMFLHASLLHIGGNMLFLWIFGNNIEDRLGRVRYLVFYLVGGVVATLVQVGLDPLSHGPEIGASGAIAAVMGMYLVLYPRVKIKSFVLLLIVPLVFDLSAFWWLGFWFVSQFFVGSSSGVAWGAHVGGFVFGMIAGVALKASSG